MDLIKKIRDFLSFIIVINIYKALIKSFYKLELCLGVVYGYRCLFNDFRAFDVYNFELFVIWILIQRYRKLEGKKFNVDDMVLFLDRNNIYIFSERNSSLF